MHSKKELQKILQVALSPLTTTKIRRNSRPDHSCIRHSFVLRYPDFIMAHKIRAAMTHHCYYTIFHDVTLSLKEQGGE